MSHSSRIDYYRPENLENLLADVSVIVAKDWYRQAIRNPDGKYFLWWRKAKPSERMSLPLVSLEDDAPNSEYTRDIQISNAWSKELAARRINDRLRVLPLLGQGIELPATLESTPAAASAFAAKDKGQQTLAEADKLLESPPGEAR